jgi:hypothetical protein
MYFDWPYYSLINGWLVDNQGKRCPFQAGPFPKDFTVAEAEAWLVDGDIRGSVAA